MDEKLYQLFEEAMEQRDKEKIKQFVLLCLEKRIEDKELFQKLLEIIEIEVKENG